MLAMAMTRAAYPPSDTLNALRSFGPWTPVLGTFVDHAAGMCFADMAFHGLAKHHGNPAQHFHDITGCLMLSGTKPR